MASKSNLANLDAMIKRSDFASQKALARQAESRGYVSDWDKLQNGFNHSKYKHVAIQKELTAERYIIVFDGPIPAHDMAIYNKRGLVCIPLLALPSYLGFLHFRRRGLDVGFSLGRTENYREHKKAPYLARW